MHTPFGRNDLDAADKAITAQDLKGETVTITNSGSSPVSLTGWKLIDEGAEAFVCVLGDHDAGRRR